MPTTLSLPSGWRNWKVNKMKHERLFDLLIKLEQDLNKLEVDIDRATTELKMQIQKMINNGE